MMHYLIQDVCMGVFLASAVVLTVASILYSLHGLWRLTLDELDGRYVQDMPRTQEPSESQCRAEDEAWAIIQACWDGTPEEENA